GVRAVNAYLKDNNSRTLMQIRQAETDFANSYEVFQKLSALPEIDKAGARVNEFGQTVFSAGKAVIEAHDRQLNNLRQLEGSLRRLAQIDSQIANSLDESAADRRKESIRLAILGSIEGIAGAAQSEEFSVGRGGDMTVS